jgi:hypothetical protein
MSGDYTTLLLSSCFPYRLFMILTTQEFCKGGNLGALTQNRAGWGYCYWLLAQRAALIGQALAEGGAGTLRQLSGQQAQPPGLGLPAPGPHDQAEGGAGNGNGEPPGLEATESDLSIVGQVITADGLVRGQRIRTLSQTLGDDTSGGARAAGSAMTRAHSANALSKVRSVLAADRPSAGNDGPKHNVISWKWYAVCRVGAKTIWFGVRFVLRLQS